MGLWLAWTYWFPRWRARYRRDGDCLQCFTAPPSSALARHQSEGLVGHRVLLRERLVGVFYVAAFQVLV